MSMKAEKHLTVIRNSDPKRPYKIDARPGGQGPSIDYLFSPRKSPPTPISHLGEGAYKVLIYDFTFLFIILYHNIREFH
jgi:hypothetical protein